MSGQELNFQIFNFYNNPTLTSTQRSLAVSPRHLKFRNRNRNGSEIDYFKGTTYVPRIIISQAQIYYIKILTNKTKHSFVLQLLKIHFPYWLKKKTVKKNDLKEFKSDYYSKKWIFTARRWHAVNAVRIKYQKYGRKINNESEVRKPNVTRWVLIRTFTFRNHNKGILYFLRVQRFDRKTKIRQKNKKTSVWKKFWLENKKSSISKKFRLERKKSSISKKFRVENKIICAKFLTNKRKLFDWQTNFPLKLIYFDDNDKFVYDINFLI